MFCGGVWGGEGVSEKAEGSLGVRGAVGGLGVCGDLWGVMGKVWRVLGVCERVWGAGSVWVLGTLGRVGAGSMNGGCKWGSGWV